MRSTALFTFLLIVAACHSGKRVDVAREFAWLEGTWKLADAESDVFEAWQLHDGAWHGESYAAVAGMKVPTEKIRLYAEGREVIFTQRVKDRDDGAPVDFRLSERTRKSWTFTNSSYPFPSTITYTRVGDVGMKVDISGIRDGDPVEIALEYVKR